MPRYPQFPNVTIIERQPKTEILEAYLGRRQHCSCPKPRYVASERQQNWEVRCIHCGWTLDFRIVRALLYGVSVKLIPEHQPNFAIPLLDHSRHFNYTWTDLRYDRVHEEIERWAAIQRPMEGVHLYLPAQTQPLVFQAVVDGFAAAGVVVVTMVELAGLWWPTVSSRAL